MRNVCFQRPYSPVENREVRIHIQAKQNRDRAGVYTGQRNTHPSSAGRRKLRWSSCIGYGSRKLSSKVLINGYVK